MRKKVMEALYRINPKITEHTDEDLIEAGFIDSFEIVNLVVELEDIFCMDIDPEEILPDNFQTVNAIINLMERLSERNSRRAGAINENTGNIR